jgi:hypothetical protein
MKFLLLVCASVLSCSAISPSPLFLFEENRGQVPEPVRYLVRTPKLQLFLSDRETTVSVGKKPVSIVLEGAGNNSRWRPEGTPSELQTDYIQGADPARWQYRIKNFHAVRRANVYPGVDQIYYSNAKRLEYDFEVKPQADPAAIRLKFSTRLKLKADGSLVAGDLVQLAPIAYQLDANGQRRNVEARWDLASANTARFVLGAYDRNQKLVIDPEIETASAIGGAGADEWVGLTRIGNTLVAAGISESLEYPGAFGRGGRDIALVLLNANTLQPLRAVFLGGSGTDRPLAISAGPITGVRVVGETDSRDFPIRAERQGVPQSIYGGGATDGFVLDYNFVAISGSTLLSTYVGGSQADRVTATNSFWFAGETKSDDIPISTPGTSYKAGWDVFSSSLDFRQGGGSLSGAFLSGSGDERANSVTFFRNLVLVGGSTDSPDLPVENAFQSQLAGGRDGFLWTASLTGSNLSPLPPVMTYWGGSGDDEIRAMVNLSISRLVIAGNTSSSDLPTRNAAQTAYGGGSSDAFLTQFNSELNSLVTSTFVGGAGADTVVGLTVQPGSLSLAGTTSSDNLPTRGSGQLTYGGGTSDAYLAEFQLDLAREELPLRSAQYLGGAASDSAFAMAGIVVGVNSDSPQGPWRGTTPLRTPGGADGFLFALSERRILGPTTDLYVGKDQILDSTFRLGGATPVPDGVPVSITSSDPARLQVSFAIDSRDAGAEDRITARVRDVFFSIRSLADSGEATVTIRAEGYSDSVVRVRLVPVQWYWHRRTGEVISSLTFPAPLRTQSATFVEGVTLREGFVIPGNNFATFPGRTPRFPSATFRFRSADPNAVVVNANSPFGTNSVSFSRVGPGDTQIIAEAEGASVPPLTITTSDQPFNPTSNTFPRAPSNLPNGVLTSVTFQQFNSNARTMIRVADPSLVRIFDPFLSELVDEMELTSSSVQLVASADAGSTQLIATANSQVTETIALNLVPAELYLQTVAFSSPLRSQTIALQPADQPLSIGTNFFNFTTLWNVENLSLEAVSSDPSVIELSSSRFTWTRSGGSSGGNFAGGISVRARGLGQAEITLRVVEGPATLRTRPFRFLVEERPLHLSGATTVGKNLSSLLSLSTSGTIPPGTVFTIESGDPTLLRAETRTITAAPFAVPTFRVVALADQGTVPLSVSAPGWPTLNVSIQLAPSAILFAAPDFGSFLPADSSPQQRQLSTVVGNGSQVFAGGFALNANGEPLLRQDPVTPVVARITNENPDVVRTPSSLTLPANNALIFDSLREGKARLTLDAGPEWSKSSLGNALDIDVLRRSFFLNSSAIVPRDTQVAYGLPQGATGRWTVRSTDPSRLLISTSPTAMGGELATVDAADPTPTVFLQALAGSGNVRLQVSNPDVVVVGTVTVSLREIAARLTWSSSSSDPFPTNPNTPQLTLSLNSQPSSLFISLVPQVSPSESSGFAQEVPLRPGVEYRIPIQVKNPEVALLTGDSFVLRSGAASQPVNLRAISTGRTEIQVGIPPQLAPPGTLTTLPVLVEGPVLRMESVMRVGKDLIRPSTVQFANVESQGNVRLNIESSDPSRVLLSTAQDQPGQASISFTTRAGTATNFFVHALASEGNVPIRASADGYTSATGEVQLRQTGLQISGLTNPSNNLNFALIQGALPFEAFLITTVIPRLTDNSSSQGQGFRLRPGANLDVAISASDAGVVEVLTPKPDLSSGSARLQFRALRPGTAELTVDAGDIPVTGSRRIRVTGRQFGISESGLLTGRQIQRLFNFSAADDVDVTITSSDPNRFLVSATATQMGSTSTIIRARQPRTYYVQGVSEGAAQITLSAPGFENRTLPVTVGSPGVNWSQSGQTTVYGLGEDVTRNVDVTVSNGNAPPDNGFNRYWPNPNVDITLNLINSNAGLLNIPTTVVLRGSAAPDIFSGFSGGTNPTSRAVRLRAVGIATGRVTVTLSAPPGWAVSGPPLTVEVLPPQIRWFETSTPGPLGQNTVRALGYDLVGPSAQNRANIRFEFSSSDPSLLRLSNRQDIPGVNALSDQPAGSQIFLHGIGSSGIANVLARWVLPGGLGFSQAPLPIPLAESIWRFNQTEVNTPRGVDTPVSLGLYLLRPQGFSSSLMLMPGANVTLNFSSSDPTVGTLRPTQLVISAPASSGNVFFNGLRAGETTLSIGPVPGFASDPAQQSVKVKVN